MHQIHRVQFKKARVEIHYTKPGDFGQDILKLESEDEPAPEMVEALKKFPAVALKEWELPEDWQGRLSSPGYQMKAVGDYFEISIIVKVLLAAVDQSITLVLPSKPEPASGLASSKCFSEESMEVIRELEREAIKFIDGQRAQGHLALEPKEG